MHRPIQNVAEPNTTEQESNDIYLVPILTY